MASSARGMSEGVGIGSAGLSPLSLARYELGAFAAIDRDPDLIGLVEQARAMLRAEFGAVDILTTSRQLRIAGTTGVQMGVSDLDLSLCGRVFASKSDPAPFFTPDARVDPLLEGIVKRLDPPESISSFTTAPLIGRDGVLLGALSVWSSQPRMTSLDDLALLVRLAARVMDVLDSRAKRPYSSPALTRGIADPIHGGRAGIDAVIDEQTVDTVFQPIVHLESGEIVGFEALSRGPKGSSLENPMALLEAAARVGRLGELDWLCRTHAMQTAANSGLPPSLSWFINVEPAGLTIACPEHLRDMLAHARSELRVVLEVVERGVDGHVSELLHACEEARADGWGIALDDVGTKGVSLALIPLLQPDVVKLDMVGLRTADENTVARTVTAVHAYAERFDAVIVAEGIETEEQQQLALIFGARYGQGYLYGRPGPLPEWLPVLRKVIPLRQRPDLVTVVSPYEILAGEGAVRRDTRSAIGRIGDLLENLAFNFRDPGVVLVDVQHARYFGPDIESHYRRLAANNYLTMIIGEQIPVAAEPGFQTVPVSTGSALARQWAVVVLNVDYAAAVAAWDCGDGGPDGQRRFDYVYTHDRKLVIAAARALTGHMEPDPDSNRLTADHASPDDDAAVADHLLLSRSRGPASLVASKPQSGADSAQRQGYDGADMPASRWRRKSRHRT